MIPPATRLLQWFAAHRRTLPWRANKQGEGNPYHIWISEIMLQQTQVKTAIPYFNKFIRRFPDIPTLARAHTDSVLRLWAGLGYYRRAHHLHAAAKALVKLHGGELPDEEAVLRTLPGIGAYSAAAIAAIAFNRPAIAIDGNLIRLFSRLLALEETGAAALEPIREQARAWLPTRRAGDYAQALMELGALVCTPTAPNCTACPLAQDCRAYTLNKVAAYPRRMQKKAKPRRKGVFFWLVRPDGKILLRRRPKNGLLGGMMEFPGSGWGARLPARPLRFAPLPDLAWRKKSGVVKHVFTHFELELTGFVARASSAQVKDLSGLWASRKEMEQLALPSLMRKACRHIEDN